MRKDWPALLLCLLLPLIAGANNGNLIVNGDFDSGSLTLPWKAAQSGKTLHKVVGGQLVITGNPANKYNSFITLTQELPKLDLTKEYMLSGKVRANVASPAGKYMKISVREVRADGSSIAYREIAVNLSEKEWVPYSLLCKPHPDAVFHMLYIITSKLSPEDTIGVDDLYFGIPPKVTAKGKNLVLNGDFEEANLAPWRCVQQSGNVRLHQLTVNTPYGKQALRVCGNPANKYNSFITLTQPLPKLDKETTYILSARVRAGLAQTKGKSLQINVRESNEQGSTLRYIGLTVNLADDVWKYNEKAIKPHKNAVAWQLYITSSGLETGDVVLLDNVSLAPEGDAGAPFDPKAATNAAFKEIGRDKVAASLDDVTGLLASLSLDGVVVHPRAKNVTVVSIEENGVERHLDGKGTASDGFSAVASYSMADGMFREIVTVKALRDGSDIVKIGVRHGFCPGQWKRQIDALRPLRILDASAPTIFSFSSAENDLNPGVLDTYQHTAYPMMVLENDDFYLLIASRSLDDFVTLAPNHPAGYFPAWQRNPKSVKAGDTYRFETNWKLFSRKTNMLRDVWRFYQEHLQTSRESLVGFFPPKYSEPRHFYHGLFGSHTYQLKEREDRLPAGTNVWFYSMHDNIHERYLTDGEWWTSGNSWARKVSATELKRYMAYLQNERKLNLIMYLRSIANLRDRENGRYPEAWFKRTPGGAMHLYGGGYDVKLPAHVAKDVGYDSVPWGHFDFANKEYKAFYLKEIFAAMDFYKPRAIGWDMGSDLDEFSILAETYDRLRKAGHHIRVVANESAGPTQPYSDMVLLENGIMGGKHPEDFEIVKAYTTAVVCLERWNIFRLAYDAYTTGRKTWLSDYGLASNKRFLDWLYMKRPDLKDKRIESARICQLRASLYDLSLGASPGYMEEAAPVPPSLMRMAADANGMLGVNRSFAITFSNNQCVEDGKYCSAWQEKGKLRVAAFNDNAEPKNAVVRLEKACFASLGWSLADLDKASFRAVTAEGEQPIALHVSEDATHILLKGTMAPFTAWMVFVDK